MQVRIDFFESFCAGKDEIEKGKAETEGASWRQGMYEI